MAALSSVIIDALRRLFNKQVRSSAHHHFCDTMSATSHSQLLELVREEGEKFNQQPLLKRLFVPPLQDNSTNTEITSASESITKNNNVIRVLQWNLLAQGLCKAKDGFILCPDAALDWKLRKNHVLEELLTYVPDILCLQEVDQFSYLEEHLQQIGFKGIFFPKPDSPCLYTENNNGPDGCAMFWNAEKVKFVSHHNLVLEASLGRATNQVAVICKFELVGDDDKNREFYVATTHLKSKFSYHKLRLLQGSFLEEFLRNHVGGLPLILCGDFNAEPSEEIINVMKKSELNLRSSYSLLSLNDDEPPYTTWKVRGTVTGKVDICHTIDYLFFTEKDFKCLQLLQFPTSEEIGEERLPSYTYPSDHLSLVVDLQLQ